MSKNKIVVVTGASSGIGLAVCQKYMEAGFIVVGLDKHVVDDRQVHTMIKCNVSDSKSVKHAFDSIRQQFVSIKYLINCAGIFFEKRRTLIDEMMLDEWNAVLCTNLTGTMLTTKAALPLLIEEKGDRAIINISSDQVLYPKKKNAAYIASKGGIVSFSKACATELMEYGIRVNIIESASVRTNFIEKLAGDTIHMENMYQKEDVKMPLGIIEPMDVAELIFFLGSDKARKITGQEILMDSGLYI